MNDTLQGAIALFIGALTTVVLMAGNYYFAGKRERTRVRDEEDGRKEREEEWASGEEERWLEAERKRIRARRRRLMIEEEGDG